jgi:hypothetical protein
MFAFRGDQRAKCVGPGYGDHRVPGNQEPANHPEGTRFVWVVVLGALFLQGVGLATAVYLILHHEEPLPPRRAQRSGASA